MPSIFRLRARLYPPLFCGGIGPFRWCALSGDPEDIYRTDEKVKELLPDNKHLHNWLDMAKKRIKFQGLPPASAGWAWAIVTGLASPSTNGREGRAESARS